MRGGGAPWHGPADAPRGRSRSPGSDVHGRRSKSRSRSPLRGRPPPRTSIGGAAGGAAPRMATKRRFSRSRSPDGSDSGSSSSSGRSGDAPQRKRRANRGTTAGAQKGSCGPAELPARLQQMEASLAQERAAREADRTKLNFLSEKVRSVAERSRNRGSMLVKILAAFRHAERAKAAVEEAKAAQVRADEELDEMVSQATSMMEGEDQGYATQLPAAGTAGTALSPAVVKEELPQQQLPAGGEAGQSLETAGSIAPPNNALPVANGVGRVADAGGRPSSAGAGAAAMPAAFAASTATQQQQPTGRGGWTQAVEPEGAGAGGGTCGRPLTGFKFKLNVT